MPLKPQEREDGEHSVTSGLLVAVVPQVTVRLFLSIGTTAGRRGLSLSSSQSLGQTCLGL
jgi:hypothetical protein